MGMRRGLPLDGVGPLTIIAGPVATTAEFDCGAFCGNVNADGL